MPQSPQPKRDGFFEDHSINEREYELLFITSLSILLDAVTTITFYLTKTGVEINPVLRKLLEINPFLVFPFLLSTLLPFFLFRFRKTIQQSVAIFLTTTHLLASINNLGILLYQTPLILDYFEDAAKGVFGAQQLSFVAGATYIAIITTYQSIKNKSGIIENLKLGAINYGIYLLAYLALNITPLLWTPLIS